MADKVTWFELPADDTARAGAFYTNVFKWSTSDMGAGSLMTITTPSDEQGTPLEAGAINGDISPRSEAFDKPLVVITVENMEDKLKKVEEAGGSIALAPKEMSSMGLIWAIITDTEGNNVGLIQHMQ